MRQTLPIIFIFLICLTPSQICAKSNSHNSNSNGGTHHVNINNPSNHPSQNSAPAQPGLPGTSGNPASGLQGGQQPNIPVQGPQVGVHEPPGGTQTLTSGTGLTPPVPTPTPVAVPIQVPNQVPTPTPVAVPVMVPPLAKTTPPVPTPTPVAVPIQVPNQMPTPTPIAVPVMVPPLAKTTPPGAGTTPLRPPQSTVNVSQTTNAILIVKSDKLPSTLPGGVNHTEIGHATSFQQAHAITPSPTIKTSNLPASEKIFLPPQVTHGVITPSSLTAESQFADSSNLKPVYCLLPTGVHSEGSFGSLLEPYAGWSAANISSTHHVSLAGGSGFSDVVLRSLPASHPDHSTCLVSIIQ